MPYNREAALAYARQWAYGRNPRYYDFESLGGDCTNFISQCLFAGCQVMNGTPHTGWYYHSLNNRSAAWTGVTFLYRFLTTNKGPGPYGHEAPLAQAKPGDIIQLSFDGTNYSHTLLVTAVGEQPDPSNILITTHSFDSENRKVSTYDYRALRLIVIDGSRGYQGNW